MCILVTFLAREGLMYLLITFYSELNSLTLILVFLFRYGGVTVGRAPAVTITKNVIYRSLGVGVATGDRFISPPPSCDDVEFRKRGRKRARRELGSSQQIPNGGGHVITGNLVAASCQVTGKYLVSKVDTRRGDGGHCGGDAVLVHQLERGL